MRKTLLFLYLLSAGSIAAYGQTRLTQDPELERQLHESGLVHQPLPLNIEHSFEANGWKKEVLQSAPLTRSAGTEGWSHSGAGSMSFSTEKTVSGKGSIKLQFPTFTGKRATGSPSDPDYATYGNSSVTYHLDGANLEKYNRIVFSIYPDCDGARIVNMNLTFRNADTPAKKGYNQPSGSHLINLINKEWNQCFLEIDEYQRDKVMSITFSTALKGKDRTTGDSAIYYLDNLQLQTVKAPEKVSGWIPADGKISYSGGWHDAGDLSQQTLQTGDVAFALLEAYNKQRNTNPTLAARLREEAEWGVEFMLKNRYGDGYRASSMGLLIWQDGVFNTLDDISSVRVQNMAFDNFLYAGYEAYASMTLDNDPMQQEYLLRVAEEDFAFAMEKFKKDGFDQFVQPYEHSYNTSKSQYMATISWSASQLYKLTGKPSYADIAAEYIRYTLDCQRTEPLKDKDGTRGFFYRDKSRKSIVHYIHQSREQVYMQAMVMLCETQKEHPDYPKWVNSIQLYGDYLKGMMKYTHPYGMIPSGVYHAEEYKDTTNFYALHLFPPANAKELYTEQIKRGVQLDKEHYMKRFPVWFNIFNGNTAIHLSNGKSAAICGNFLKDKELLNIGLEQLYWTVGKNPFGQSLIYGEGHNYPQLNTFSSGEMTGEMPVGIRTLGNDDVPYWPQTNNACYKEVWVTSAGKWLSLTAEY